VKQSEHFADLVGEVVGTYRCEELAEGRSANGSRYWLFRCSCGRTRQISTTDVRELQKAGKRPRCYCPEYREFIAREGIVYPRRCGLCKATDHRIADCPKRTPARWCNDCAGMPWRVRGIKCRGCGLRHRAEPAVELDVTGIGSSAGGLDRFAMGGDKADSIYRRPKKARAA
jgi:hypothetical protein